MRTAFVVGFFDKVQAELRGEFAAQLDGGALVWIGLDRYDPRKAFNVNAFKTAFSRTMADGSADDIMIILADLVPWATSAVEGIAGGYAGGRSTRVERLRDARSAGPVLDLLRAFGPAAETSAADVVSEAAVAAFLSGARLLCVRGNHQPAFEEVFRRGMFASECFERHCTEKVYDVQKNSNLIRDLKDAATHYGCVLYAWHGLRTAPNEVKTKYAKGHFFEDSTPARVLNAFRRAVLGQARRA